MISNPRESAKSLELEMVIDSGATYTWVPADFLLELGIVPTTKRKLRLATGETIERDAGIIDITIERETLPTFCVFGDPESEALLGAITLEEFSLGVDPVNKKLVPMISVQFSNVDQG